MKMGRDHESRLDLLSFYLVKKNKQNHYGIKFISSKKIK